MRRGIVSNLGSSARRPLRPLWVESERGTSVRFGSEADASFYNVMESSLAT